MSLNNSVPNSSNLLTGLLSCWACFLARLDTYVPQWATCNILFKNDSYLPNLTFSIFSFFFTQNYWLMYIRIYSEHTLMILTMNCNIFTYVLTICLLFIKKFVTFLIQIFWLDWIYTEVIHELLFRLLDFFSKKINIVEQISNLFFHSEDKTAGKLERVSQNSKDGNSMPFCQEPMHFLCFCLF